MIVWYAVALWTTVWYSGTYWMIVWYAVALWMTVWYSGSYWMTIRYAGAYASAYQTVIHTE